MDAQDDWDDDEERTVFLARDGAGGSIVPDPSPDPGQWHASQGGVQYGPLSPEGVRRMVEQGIIKESALFWREGIEGWKAPKELPELAHCLAFSTGRADHPARPEVERSSPAPVPAPLASSQNPSRSLMAAGVQGAPSLLGAAPPGDGRERKSYPSLRPVTTLRGPWERRGGGPGDRLTWVGIAAALCAGLGISYLLFSPASPMRGSSEPTAAASGQSARPSVGKVRVSSSGSLPSTAVESTVAQSAGPLQQECWLEARTTRAVDAPEVASVTLEMEIDATGLPKRVYASDTAEGYLGLERCLVNGARSWSFGAAPGTTKARVTFQFRLSQ